VMDDNSSPESPVSPGQPVTTISQEGEKPLPTDRPPDEREITHAEVETTWGEQAEATVPVTAEKPHEDRPAPATRPPDYTFLPKPGTGSIVTSTPKLKARRPTSPNKRRGYQPTGRPPDGGTKKKKTTKSHKRQLPKREAAQPRRGRPPDTRPPEAFSEQTSLPVQTEEKATPRRRSPKTPGRIKGHKRGRPPDQAFPGETNEAGEEITQKEKQATPNNYWDLLPHHTRPPDDGEQTTMDYSLCLDYSGTEDMSKIDSLEDIMPTLQSIIDGDDWPDVAETISTIPNLSFNEMGEIVEDRRWEIATPRMTETAVEQNSTGNNTETEKTVLVEHMDDWPSFEDMSSAEHSRPAATQKISKNEAEKMARRGRRVSIGGASTTVWSVRHPGEKEQRESPTLEEGAETKSILGEDSQPSSPRLFHRKHRGRFKPWNVEATFMATEDPPD
jgi:hypothetical protein